MKQIILIAIMAFSSLSFAGLKYDYGALMMKDLEDINKMMMQKIKKSKRQNSLQPLVDALVLICSRPDDGDGILGKVWPRLHTELRSRKIFDKVVIAGAKQAIAGAKNNDLSKAKQATYFTTLTNMISLFGGYAKNSPPSKKVLMMIAKADIEVTDRIKRERKMRVMRRTISPSKIAQSMLNKLFPKPKED